MVEANAVVYEGEQRVVRVGSPALQPRALEGQHLLVPDGGANEPHFGNLNVRDFPAVRRLFQCPRAKSSPFGSLTIRNSGVFGEALQHADTSHPLALLRARNQRPDDR